MNLDSNALISALSSSHTDQQFHGLFQLQTAPDRPEDAINLLQRHPGVLAAVVELVRSTNVEVQHEAVKTLCILMGDSKGPVNQDLLGARSSPAGFAGLSALLTAANEETQQLACVALERLVIRHPVYRDHVGAAPGILDLLVSLLASDNVHVQQNAANALRFVTAGHRPNQERVGAMPLAISSLASLLCSRDTKVQEHAAYALAALADMHLDNGGTIVQLGAVPMLAVLLSSTDPRVQEAAATVLLNLCSIQPQQADWVNSCSWAIQGLVSLLQQRGQRAQGRALAALTLVMLASCKSRVLQVLQQHATAVWSAMPYDVVSALKMHPLEVMELLRALQKLASSSQALKQSMQDSPQLLLMLQGLQAGQGARGAVQRLLDTLSAGSPSSRPASSASSEGSPDPWCPCCQDTPKQLVFRCGHATCEGCRAQLNPPICPVCRADISAFQLRLFL